MPDVKKRRRKGKKVLFSPKSYKKMREEPSSLTGPLIISEAEIIEYIEREFDCTLPFWRCFVELKASCPSGKVTVVDHQTELLCVIPCVSFKAVQVVWAVTTVTVQCAGSFDGERRGTRQQTWHIGTMHFVHVGSQALFAKNSFHIQSVVHYDEPSILQCVAGTMVNFGLALYSCTRCVLAQREGIRLPLLEAAISEAVASPTTGSSEEGAAAQDKEFRPFIHIPAEGLLDVNKSKCPEYWRLLCPPPTARILVLGMGGNSMAIALRCIIGPQVQIDVVEMEPAVAAACKQAGTFGARDQPFTVHLETAETIMPSFPDNTFDFIFMDLFDPMVASMNTEGSIVYQCMQKLTLGGLLLVNDHQLPSAKCLAKFMELCGSKNVTAVNLHDSVESVVVCMKTNKDPLVEGLLFHTGKPMMDIVHEGLYKQLAPGILPPASWLESDKELLVNGTPCRVFVS